MPQEILSQLTQEERDSLFAQLEEVLDPPIGLVLLAFAMALLLTLAIFSWGG